MPQGKKAPRGNRTPRTTAAPAPEASLLTITQVEDKHPGVRGKMRSWVHRADADDPALVLLKAAIIRVGRSVFIDGNAFNIFLNESRSGPPATPRSRGRFHNRDTQPTEVS